jgi:hypothetical protein
MLLADPGTQGRGGCGIVALIVDRSAIFSNLPFRKKHRQEET